MCDAMTWDVLLLVLSTEKRFRFALACLCKNLPLAIAQYNEAQKYIWSISRPISPVEIPQNCGFASLEGYKAAMLRADTRGEAEIITVYTGSCRVFENGESKFEIRTRTDRQASVMNRSMSVDQITETSPFLDYDENTVMVWYPDVISLIEIVLARMRKNGRINLRIAKEIAVNTLVHMQGDAEFLHIFCVMHVILRLKRSHSVMLLSSMVAIANHCNVEQLIGEVDKSIVDYVPNVADTFICHQPCDAYLTPQTII